MNRSITNINADVAAAEVGARGQGIVWAVVAAGIDLYERGGKECLG